MKTAAAMASHSRLRANVLPDERTPVPTLLEYAISRPKKTRMPAYSSSWTSKMPHTAPADRVAQVWTRAGSTRSAPISVGPVEVAGLEQIGQAQVLLYAVVHLQEVLDDLGRRVADGPRVLDE